MKRVILFVLILLTAFSAACAEKNVIVEVNAIDEVNDNMSLPFPLALPEEELVYGEEYVRDEGFGCCTLRKDGLVIWISGWPDVIDPYHVTKYIFTDDKYNVFDISVGDALDDAATVLMACGYSWNEEDHAQHDCRDSAFEKQKQVRITLRVDENDVVYEICITAIATNKDDIVF